MQIGEFLQIQREIARYNALPVIFSGFVDSLVLRDDTAGLLCVDMQPAEPLMGTVPAYGFEIWVNHEKVGIVSLRIGYTRALYYSGQIGYMVDVPFRGNGYAARACNLLVPLMRAHGMTKALITNNPENHASRRVCEKLGAKLLRIVKIPKSHALYEAGDRYKNIFEWDIMGRE